MAVSSVGLGNGVRGKACASCTQCKSKSQNADNEGAKYERVHQQSVLQRLGGWGGRGVVGARVVAISTSGMPFARGTLRTMFVDYGVLSLGLTKLLALDVPFMVLLFVLLSHPPTGVGVWGIWV